LKSKLVISKQKNIQLQIENQALLVSHSRGEELQTSILKEVRVLEDAMDLLYNMTLTLHQVKDPCPKKKSELKERGILIK